MIKVMIVDDEAPIRKWLDYCIQKLEGYNVVGIAANGAEGYSLFRHEMPDIIITDIRMPGINGLEMLKMIRNINPSVYTLVLTSHEDFGYARQAIQFGVSDYILKTEITEDNLIRLLDKAKENINKYKSIAVEKSYEEISNRNNYLRSLVLKNKTEIENEIILRNYNIPINKSPYYALNIIVDKEEDRDKFQIPDNKFLTNIVTFPLDLYNTMIVGNIQTEYIGKGSKKLEGCFEYCRIIQRQTNCKIGISDEYTNVDKIIDAMIQARRRTNISFYHPHETIFYSQATDKIRPVNGEKYRMLFNKELVNQNYSKAVEIKNQLISEIWKEEPYDTGYVKELVYYLITDLLYFTNEDMETVELQLTEIKPKIMNCKLMRKLEEEINAIFQKQGYLDNMDYEYSYYVRKAISYMDKYYMESITLQDVAGHISLSPEYLSRMFKEETGVNFIVYLNNLRLKNAIYLLENTYLKVYEIAEKTGYSNLSYFSTVFKKKIGMNPFEYRNNSNKNM